jgi:hypothetical protein
VVGVPPEGLGLEHTRIAARMGWPSGTRDVLNEALSIYFGDATDANAFVGAVVRRRQGETAGGVFQARDDDAEARVSAGKHKTP